VPGSPSYPGLYCDWSVTGEDEVEVWSYRACLSAVAVSCLVCSSAGLIAPRAWTPRVGDRA